MDWAGGLLETFHGVFIGAFLFSVALFEASRQSPSAVHPCTEEAQDRRQSVTSGSSDTKRSACESSLLVTISRFIGTNPPSWVQSTGGTPLHLLPWCAVSSLETQGQSPPAIPAFGADNAVWRHQGLQVCTYFQNELLGRVGHQDSVAPGWTSRVHVLPSLAGVLAVGITANKSQPHPSMTLGKAV